MIEVFADIWCPFAHVGLRAVADRRHQAGHDEVGLRVRAWPLELVNGAPMDPAKVAHHVHDLTSQVAPGLFAGFDVEHFPTSTLEALALTARADAIDPALGERTAFALRDALFEQGRDIGDPAVVARIADDLGIGVPTDVDRAAVLADHEEGRRRGVVGSPHFFHPGGALFCPALSISRTSEGELVVSTEIERLDAFLEECFRQS